MTLEKTRHQFKKLCVMTSCEKWSRSSARCEEKVTVELTAVGYRDNKQSIIFFDFVCLLFSL